MAKITICRWVWDGFLYEGDYWRDTVEDYYEDFIKRNPEFPVGNLQDRIEREKDDWMRHLNRVNAFVEVELEEG